MRPPGLGCPWQLLQVQREELCRWGDKARPGSRCRASQLGCQRLQQGLQQGPRLCRSSEKGRECLLCAVDHSVSLSCGPTVCRSWGFQNEQTTKSYPREASILWGRQVRSKHIQSMVCRGSVPRRKTGGRIGGGEPSLRQGAEGRGVPFPKGSEGAGHEPLYVRTRTQRIMRLPCKTPISTSSHSSASVSSSVKHRQEHFTQ